MKIPIDIDGRSYFVKRFKQNEKWFVAYKKIMFSGRTPETVTALFHKWVKAGCPEGNFQLQENDIDRSDLFTIRPNN